VSLRHTRAHARTKARTRAHAVEGRACEGVAAPIPVRVCLSSTQNILRFQVTQLISMLVVCVAAPIPLWSLTEEEVREGGGQSGTWKDPCGPSRALTCGPSHSTHTHIHRGMSITYPCGPLYPCGEEGGRQGKRALEREREGGGRGAGGQREKEGESE
jgi:hypothetical protein